MSLISEEKFAEICREIHIDRQTIIKHNPIGTEEEILLWMLLGVLNSYLNLQDNEMPCFPGKPTADTYRQAILYVLNGKKTAAFDAEKHLEQLIGR